MLKCKLASKEDKTFMNESNTLTKEALSTPSHFHQQDAAVMNQEVDPHQNPRLAAPWPLCFNF